MEKLVKWMAVAVVFVFAFLGIYFLFWLLWVWVLPQLWPTGPAAFIEPGYWLFVGVGILLGFVVSFFRGKK